VPEAALPFSILKRIEGIATCKWFGAPATVLAFSILKRIEGIAT